MTLHGCVPLDWILWVYCFSEGTLIVGWWDVSGNANKTKPNNNLKILSHPTATSFLLRICSTGPKYRWTHPKRPTERATETALGRETKRAMGMVAGMRMRKNSLRGRQRMVAMAKVSKTTPRIHFIIHAKPLCRNRRIGAQISYARTVEKEFTVKLATNFPVCVVVDLKFQKYLFEWVWTRELLVKEEFTAKTYATSALVFLMRGCAASPSCPKHSYLFIRSSETKCPSHHCFTHWAPWAASTRL